MIRAFAIVALLAACGDPDVVPDAGAPIDSCDVLFGMPNDQTGLGADRCQPACRCGDKVFAPPAYDAAFTQSLIDDWQIDAPFAPLASNPYDVAAPPADPPDTVCAVLPTGDATARPRHYTLATYPSMAAAMSAGAHPTHYGHCGVCSTLANLAVYVRRNDLTQPVRACAFASAPDGGDPDVECLLGLGFDLPCAQIWSYNTAHTQSVCLATCLQSLTDPYNLPDGTLNACLQCDEDQSGPVFKAVAGRTRRNSGLPNAICRPCAEVQPLVHAYD